MAVAVEGDNSSAKAQMNNNSQWAENGGGGGFDAAQMQEFQQQMQQMQQMQQQQNHHNNSSNQEGGEMNQNVYEMGGDVNGGDGQGNWADDTIERSGSLFGQLDSMIAAVQNESSALDSMREKLKELDGMRNQLSSLTKVRLLPLGFALLYSACAFSLSVPLSRLPPLPLSTSQINAH